MIKINGKMITNKLDLDELIMYETPTIAEFVAWGPLARLIEVYVARKVRRKLARLQKRHYREDYLRRKGYLMT